MQGQYSLRSPAVKRLMKEAQELCEATAQFHAQPLEDNLFEWHFTIRGPDDSEFSDGIYHGRIILPPDYPMKPPSIIILTPNGRFETYTKICLSISGHHPESWQPSWSIRTALLAIIGFMPTHGGGAIGSLDYTPEERKRLAKKTQDFKCPQCGDIKHILRPVSEASKADTEEAKELASQINFQGEKKAPVQQQDSSASSTTDVSSNAGSTPSSPSSPTPQPQAGAPLPPWQGLPNSFPPGMQRFPFMPFMPRPPSTTASAASQSQAAMHFSQMAAMQAAMQQHMRAQSSRFPAWGHQGNMGMFPMYRPPTATPTPNPAQPTSQTSSSAATSSPASKSETTTTTEAKPTSTAAAAAAEPTNVNQASAEPSPAVAGNTEGVRQRTTPSSASPATPPRSPCVSTARRPAEIPRRSQQARPSNVVTTVLIVVLSIAFFALLLRRLSLMGVIRYDQDADL